MPKRAVLRSQKAKQSDVVDLDAKRREKDAAAQRAKRARGTASEYDRNYKKAQEKALRRLKDECPKRYIRLFNEERAKLGMAPVRKRG